MSRRPKIEVMRERHEAAKLSFQIERFNRARKVMQKWDATEPSRARRQPTHEIKGEGSVYDMHKRMRGCNIGRDLERNYSPAKSILHQFRVNVVGSLGKMKLNLPEDAGKEATDYYNEVWAKDCDFRDAIDWSTQLQNTLASVIREGDMLAVIDDGAIDDNGKMLTWEADQIAPVSDAILKAKGYAGHEQDNGIIRDKWGRVVAYCASGKRGARVIDNAEDVTIWKADQARLVRNPWRLNQGRGTPSILTPSTNFIDLYEILSGELATSKRASKQYAYVSRKDAVTDWDNPTAGPEWLPENSGRTAEDVAGDGANQETQTAKNYESLEALTGGLMDYIQPGEEVKFPESSNPNPQLAPFLEAVHGYCGAALGLARAYTILRADSSYTSFRGDMIMTWVTFYWMQKWLERTICDFTGAKVLAWAQRKGHIKTLPEGWERRMSWAWPVMPEVDELDAQNAIAQALKNGTTDWAQLLGPDWRSKLRALAEQKDEIIQLELPLGFLEMKSGGSANPKKDGDQNEKT